MHNYHFALLVKPNNRNSFFLRDVTGHYIVVCCIWRHCRVLSLATKNISTNVSNAISFWTIPRGDFFFSFPLKAHLPSFTCAIQLGL